MKLFSIVFGIIAAMLVIAALLLIFGVRFTSDRMAYDPAKVIEVKGTVMSVSDFACPASDGELGSHIVIKTANGDYEVHLAPARVMRSINWVFQPGQVVEVNGAEVRYQGKEGLIARQIVRGDEVFTFRDANGHLLVKQQ